MGMPDVSRDAALDRILAFRDDFDDCSAFAGLGKYPVLHRAGFLHDADRLSLPDRVSLFDQRFEQPLFLRVQGRHLLPSADERAAVFLNLIKRALDSVINAAEQSRSEPDDEGAFGSKHDVAGLDARRVLVDLDSRHVA